MKRSALPEPMTLAELFSNPKRRPKYGNRKVVVDELKFDSAFEASRWFALKQMERAGLIHDLKRQVSFVLAASVKFTGARAATPALRYVADATYIEGGHLVVEDCKGHATEGYRIKRHLLLAVHGIEIKEVRK